ncbi:hypothetical protein C0989_000441 [Termitomyces sp. Mn162]|nr:hypothetical protein C0989_000441 [Termitomyces sp. Mn162]
MQYNRPYYISPELQRIVKKCRKLTELALRDVIPQVVTLYSDLEIFLAYNLTRLRIDSYWSSLESFPKDITKLAPEPCKPGPYGLDQIGDWSHFTLNDLFHPGQALSEAQTAFDLGVHFRELHSPICCDTIS